MVEEYLPLPLVAIVNSYFQRGILIYSYYFESLFFYEDQNQTWEKWYQCASYDRVATLHVGLSGTLYRALVYHQKTQRYDEQLRQWLDVAFDGEGTKLFACSDGFVTFLDNEEWLPCNASIRLSPLTSDYPDVPTLNLPSSFTWNCVLVDHLLFFFLACHFFCFDLVNKSLRVCSSAGIAEWKNFATASCNQQIFVFGGESTSATFGASDRVCAYDIATDTWTDRKPMLCVRSRGTAILYEEKIHVFGGVHGNANVVSHDCYDPRLDVWTRKEWHSFIGGICSAVARH